MKPTDNIIHASIMHFAQANFEIGITILNEGYRSYGFALTEFDHKVKVYDPENEMLTYAAKHNSNTKRLSWESATCRRRSIWATITTNFSSGLAAGTKVQLSLTGWP